MNSKLVVLLCTLFAIILFANAEPALKRDAAAEPALDWNWYKRDAAVAYWDWPDAAAEPAVDLNWYKREPYYYYYYRRDAALEDESAYNNNSREKLLCLFCKLYVYKGMVYFQKIPRISLVKHKMKYNQIWLMCYDFDTRSCSYDDNNVAFDIGYNNNDK
ncbi:hypothetical protein Glove_31g34 [Diversispora epigaea]|uniref:Uncharacterized protein n=1 Tax=Diversispora epigaea TaxID=1348612 RepID=A0A397JHB2_9GLOM|nr:hypothetical protein Glove_31g34 [Diversispora epigaea]